MPFFNYAWYSSPLSISPQGEKLVHPPLPKSPLTNVSLFPLGDLCAKLRALFVPKTSILNYPKQGILHQYPFSPITHFTLIMVLSTPH
jgi:hypothetical protein